MTQLRGEALLRPMRADSLLRAPEPRAAVKSTVQAAPERSAAGSPLMRPASFERAPLGARGEPWDMWQAEPPEEPEDDEGEDAVPTSEMPVPAPVPLDLPPARERGRGWRTALAVLAALAALAACALWGGEWIAALM